MGGSPSFVIPAVVWQVIVQVPTPHPTPPPTHAPTRQPKSYSANSNQMRTIGQNAKYYDIDSYCHFDSDANGGWDIYSTYQGNNKYYSLNSYAASCESHYGDEPDHNYIQAYGPYSGDRISDPEPRFMSQYFRCTHKSYVYISWKYLCCSGDYNDFFELYFNYNNGGYQQKHFARCSQLYKYWGYYVCEDYESYKIYLGTVNAYIAFLIQFRIQPTFYDDQLSLGDIVIECDQVPTKSPTPAPTRSPTPSPTDPTKHPTTSPTNPTYSPTFPTYDPTMNPLTDPPTDDPTNDPTFDPTKDPTTDPTYNPSVDPSLSPTTPTFEPTVNPTEPTVNPTNAPSIAPTFAPSDAPSSAPSIAPSIAPTGAPTHSIQIVDIFWYDDYIFNEKIDEWDNFEIGWTIHNANTSLNQASHMMPGIPLTGDNTKISNQNFRAITKINNGEFINQTFHGPYVNQMMAPENSLDSSVNERNFISMFRDFECKSQSYVTLWYTMLFCDHTDANKIFHSLEIKSWDEYQVFNASGYLINMVNFTNITNTNITEIKLDNNGNQISGSGFPNCETSDNSPVSPEMIDIKWHSNYTAFDDRPWKMKLEFELTDPLHWFMLTNFTIYCDLKYPSAAPTQAPSGSPSQPPTDAPTFSPTYSPTTCPDYGENYTNVDGEDHIVDPYDYISYIPLGGTPDIVTSSRSGDFIARTFNCTNPDGCTYDCADSVSCLVADIYCNSPTGCNIHCGQLSSCDKLTIYANGSVTGHSLTVVCEGEKSCKDLKLYTSGVSRAEVHCMAENSCASAKIYFDEVSIYNNSNTFVACYVTDACTSLAINADGKYSQLRMYEYSASVTLDNGYGYFSEIDQQNAIIPNVECGFDQKYIKWDAGYSNDQAAQYFHNETYKDLILREWKDSIWPCAGVSIACNRNLTSGVNDIFNVIRNGRSNCDMEIYMRAVDVNPNEPKFAGKGCVYAWLEELLQLTCIDSSFGNGTCLSDASDMPTPAPTLYPTYTPTNAPTFSPSFSPSIAPTLSPTPAPSFSPSLNPTIAPSIAPSLAPSISPSIAPTGAPTQPPTNYPTFSPTQAPTRPPTRFGNIYDSKLQLVYIFTNFTHSNYEWLLNITQPIGRTHIFELSEFIESQYIGGRLPSYNFFWLQFLKINGIDINGGEKNKINMDLLLNKINKPYPEIHIKSVIEFERTYENYIVNGISKNPDWAEDTVTPALRLYMNNSNAHFRVGNYSTLAVEYDQVEPPPDYGFYAVNIFLGLFILIAILGLLHNKKHLCGNSTYLFFPVDNGNWIAMIVYGLQIYDMVSDINLTTEIFGAIFNRECTIITGYDVPCANDGNCWGLPESEPEFLTCQDDPEKVDTFQEYALLISGIFSLTFLFIPYGLNIAYAARIPGSNAIKQNPSAREWFDKYQSFFISLVVLSGGCYPALNLVSSNIFGLSILNTGLSSFELSGLSDIRVITTVVTENGPQLLVQMLYTYSINEITQNTTLAFATSIMSIVASVLNYFINKDKAGQVYDVFYYLELKAKNSQQLESDGSEKKKKKKKLSKKEIKHIKVRKGLKLDLASKIAAVYPDVDVAHFEIGYVTIRKDNIVIRCCQHLHEQDLNITLNEEDYNKYTNDYKKQQAKLRPFKNYCYELFAANRESVEQIVFQHFSNLKIKKYKMIYHKEYPVDKNVDKILHGGGRSKVFKDLIKEQGGMSVDLDDDDDGGDIEEGISINMKKKKKKQTPVSRHRDQFKQAYDLLIEAVNIYFSVYGRDKDNHCVSKSQINKWKHLLQSNNIHHLVINDVIDFAITSQLFIKEEAHDSDIDSSDESMELFKNDDEFILQQKKIKLARMLNTPEEPKWFTSNHTNDNVGEDEGLELEQKNKKTNNTKNSFWNSFNKAKKNKKKNKKKEKKLKNSIELGRNVKGKVSFTCEDDIEDGDIQTALDEWANE